MAMQMNEQERLQALKDYNPREHLVKIKSKKTGELKDYLPASWRLYELSLRYPDANFATEIVYFDPERNLVLVKCRLYLGSSYEQSTKKVEACKSGLLSELDRVETGAQARCARLFGIGTEYALDMDDEETSAPHGSQKPSEPNLAAQGNGKAPQKTGVWRGVKPSVPTNGTATTTELNRVYAKGREAKCFTDPASFAEFCKNVLCLEKVVDVHTLSAEQMCDVEAAVFQVAAQNGND